MSYSTRLSQRSKWSNSYSEQYRGHSGYGCASINDIGGHHRVGSKSRSNRIHQPIEALTFSRLVTDKKLCPNRIYYVRDGDEIFHYYALNECQFYFLNERTLPCYELCEW